MTTPHTTPRTSIEAVRELNASDWTPEYDSWRHGGWYVSNLHRTGGAVGCVSRNYPDRKWRIVCDDRDGDHTYRSRDDAAYAEYVLYGQGRATKDIYRDALERIAELPTDGDYSWRAIVLQAVETARQALR